MSTSTMDQNAVLNFAMKIKYRPRVIINTVNTRSDIYDLFKYTFAKLEDSGTEGMRFEYAMQLGNSESNGMRDENGFVPIGSIVAGVKGQARLKKQMIRVDTTWNALSQAVGGEDSFATFTDMVMLPAVDSSIDDLNRQCIGYGPGILCRVDGTPALAMPVDAPYGIASDTGGVLTSGLRRQMRIVYGPNADGTGLRSAGQSSFVEATDPDANAGGGTVTVTSFPPDVADNDFIWKGDDDDNNAPSAGVEKEMMGLLGFVDNGTRLETLQNISRTTNPELKSRVVDGSVAPYSGGAPEQFFQRLADDARTYGKGVTSHLLCTPATWRVAHSKIVSTQGGYGATQQPGSTIKGSAERITYNLNGRTAELRKSDRLPKGIVFALDQTTFKRMGDETGDWDQRTGSMWRQVTVGSSAKDIYWALYRFNSQNWCSDPRKNVQGTGVNEDLA